MTGRLSLRLAVAAALASILAMTPAAADTAPDLRPFVPDWKVGQKWTVEARYRLPGGGVPGASGLDAVWTAPVTWRYEVMNHSRDRNLEVYRVRAQEVSKTGKASAGFIFLGERNAAGRMAWLALARAGYRADERPGEPESVDYTRRSTGPYPILSELSIVPADFPHFAAGEPPPGKPILVTRYEVTEESHGMFLARDVEQTVTEAKTEKEDERLKVPVSEEQELLQITVRRPSDRSAFRQLWTSSAPWFLYSENARMKAWLVGE